MRRLLACMLTIALIVCMTLIFTGCGNKDDLDNNPSDNQGQTVNGEGYDQVIKAELLDEKGKPYNGYEFYIYYYFKEDKLIAQDNVYIFGTDNEAKIWYDNHITIIVDPSVSQLDGRKVIDKESDLQYKDWKYDDILKFVKDNIRTIGYTEE